MKIATAKRTAKTTKYKGMDIMVPWEQWKQDCTEEPPTAQMVANIASCVAHTLDHVAKRENKGKQHRN